MLAGGAADRQGLDVEHDPIQDGPVRDVASDDLDDRAEQDERTLGADRLVLIVDVAPFGLDETRALIDQLGRRVPQRDLVRPGLDGLTETEALECIKHTWAVRSAKCLCDNSNCVWDHDKDPAYWLVLFSDDTLPDGTPVTQDTPRAFPVTIAWWS